MHEDVLKPRVFHRYKDLLETEWSNGNKLSTMLSACGVGEEGTG